MATSARQTLVDQGTQMDSLIVDVLAAARTDAEFLYEVLGPAAIAEAQRLLDLALDSGRTRNVDYASAVCLAVIGIGKARDPITK